MRRESIELLLDWLDAIRREDVDAATAGLAPDVVWHRTRDDLLCAGAAQVVSGFLDARETLDDVEAFELIGRDTAAVLGSRGADGTEVYNVFRFSDGRVITIEDYASREDALAAATAVAP